MKQQPPRTLAKLPYSALVAPSPATVATLRTICQTHGFFILTGHPLPPALLRATAAASRAFFALPEPAKRAYGHHAQLVVPPTARGYSPSRDETLNMTQGADRKQLFDLGIERPFRPAAFFTGPTTMPPEDVAPGFGTGLFRMQHVVTRRMVPVVARALALALGKEAAFFDGVLQQMLLIQRVIYYPPGEGTAGKHTDNGLFTLLFQEEAAGEGSLKVYTGGEWISVEARETDVVVNLGDMLQFWSDGLFVSTPHMVRHCADVSRVSLPFFVYPDIEQSFVPLGKGEEERVQVVDVVMRNYDSIWVNGTGAGRARELV